MGLLVCSLSLEYWLRSFGVCWVWHIDDIDRAQMKEVLLNSPFKENSIVLWQGNSFAILWGILSERNNRILREVERSFEGVWELA